MIEDVRTRLVELEREYAAGEQQLADLVRRQSAVRETLLRISGAVQVLRELTEHRGAGAADGDGAGAGDGDGAGDHVAGAVLTVP